MKVLVYSARPDEMEYFKHFAKQFNLEMGYCQYELNMDIVERAKGYEALLCVGNDKLNGEILEKFASFGIKYISMRTIGYDNVDMEVARKLGIRVAHATYSPYSVANYTVMLMIMCLRKALYIMMRSQTGDYSLTFVKGREMQNMTVGIVGTGRIGRAVIQNLSGFGCKILAYSPHVKEIPNVENVSLEELYKRSDIISLHTVLNNDTYHMINKNSIAKMKKGAIIINTARGPLIDTADLIAEIENGHIASVGIDCFEEENGIVHTNHNYSLINNHDMIILKSFPNTIVTPHVAFYTDQAVQDMVYTAMENVALFRDNKAVPLEVK